MKRIVLVSLAIILSMQSAFAASIEIGAALGKLQPYIDGLLTLGISALVGWVLYIIKNKLHVSIDDSMRDALQTWASRQASSLVADGFVKVQGLKVDVPNAALANVANLGLKEIPDALQHFGITPDKLMEMVKDKIPHVPSVAAVAAAQTTTPAS